MQVSCQEGQKPKIPFLQVFGLMLTLVVIRFVLDFIKNIRLIAIGRGFELLLSRVPGRENDSNIIVFLLGIF